MGDMVPATHLRRKIVVLTEFSLVSEVNDPTPTTKPRAAMEWVAIATHIRIPDRSVLKVG